MYKLLKQILSRLNFVSKKKTDPVKKVKVFKKKEFRKLIPDMGGCIATDKITVDGLPVKRMYRQEPINDVDSGWQFFSGTETQEYLDDLSNTGVYALNTIANYDESIIPYLDYPYGVELEKDEATGRFNIIPG